MSAGRIFRSPRRERANEALVSPRASPDDPEPPVVDERLYSLQAFRRFVARVTPWAYRWLVRLRVAARDRDDVLQEALIAAFRRRDSYDPARGRWEGWAFGFLSVVVRNYRKRTARRLERVDVAEFDLPDVVADAPSPDEEADEKMRRVMLERCLEGIDDDSRAVLLARAEGIPFADIAAALGVAESTAYVYYKDAREQVQKALEREQSRKRAMGLAVLPVSLDQLLTSDGPPPDVPAETMRRVWNGLDRAMAQDIDSGKLPDDGTDAPRYMGRPGLAPRAGILRALVDPRISHVLTALFGALGGALVTYQVMRHPPAPRDTAAEARFAATAVESGASLPATATSTTFEVSTPQSSAGPLPEPREARAPDPARTGASPSARAPDDGEQALVERAIAAYQARLYGDAIKAFEEHTRKYPRGQFAGSRERLLTLALISAGRKTEARQRVESLRRADPQNQALVELDAALASGD